MLCLTRGRTHNFCEFHRYPICHFKRGPCSETSITCGGLGLHVTKELTNDGKTLAHGNTNRCEGVPQVMNADIM
jgi:hypothetical protein